MFGPRTYSSPVDPGGSSGSKGEVEPGKRNLAVWLGRRVPTDPIALYQRSHGCLGGGIEVW